ncbi:MAG: hypothetical protein DMG71_05850 [Acidobacteria bacterium]|nr:MAG: hypothetical protein DMG71_05850 [Acidobacteriota bacterium]
MKFLSLTVVLSFAICSPLWAQAAGSVTTNNATPSSTAASPVEQQIIQNVRQFVQANTKKDADYFKRTLTDDFIEVPKNGGTSDRAEFLEDVTTGDKSKEPRLYNIKVVPLNEGAALATYDEILPGDETRYRHITHVWVKQGDQWKLKFLQTTPNLWSIGDV